MKKLSVFLCAMVLVFGSVGTGNSATLNMTCDTIWMAVAPHVTSEYNFTIEVDDTTGNVLGWTDLMSNYFYAGITGGNDPRAGNTPFTAGQQIYPNGVYQSASTAFDGDTSAAGTTLWWKFAHPDPDGPFAGSVFNVGVLGLTYEKVTGHGTMQFGPNMMLSETYFFHQAAVPIPSAIWLLGSGLIGLVGFRKKFRKEA